MKTLLFLIVSAVLGLAHMAPGVAYAQAAATEGSSGYSRDSLERDGFVAVAPGQGETINGGRLMLIAYGLLWLLMAGYVVGIARRQSAVASELDELRKRLAEVDDDLQRHEKKQSA
jgi:hypothetical protein